VKRQHCARARRGQALMFDEQRAREIL